MVRWDTGDIAEKRKKTRMREVSDEDPDDERSRNTELNVERQSDLDRGNHGHWPTGEWPALFAWRHRSGAAT